MFNMKWSLICAAAAFALAFAVSLLLGHTTLLVALFRAVIFAILFFGLGAGVWALINTFLPELLTSGGGGENVVDSVFSSGGSGSQVNITVDDAPNAALPEANNDRPETDEVGNFSDLIIGSISAPKDVDQNPPTSYTEETEEVAPAFGNIKLEEVGDFSMDFGAFVSDGIDGEGLEELDNFSFLSGSENAEGASAPERKASGNKPLKLEGDFNPKDIAAGLRTVLEKEKKRG